LPRRNAAGSQEEWRLAGAGALERLEPMPAFVEVRGQSGHSYTFRPVSDAGLLPATGAVTIAARRARGAWTVLKLGQTENLSRESWGDFSDVQSVRGVELFYRLHVAAARREEELADLTSIVEAADVQAA
jgi:hypothetical protein